MSQINGALAQLGERYTGSVEVSGSSPLCSISESLDISRGFFIVKETRLVLKNPFEAWPAEAEIILEVL